MVYPWMYASTCSITRYDETRVPVAQLTCIYERSDTLMWSHALFFQPHAILTAGSNTGVHKQVINPGAAYAWDFRR